MRRVVWAPLAIMLVAVLGGSTPARGDATSLLQVFEAQSSAAPIGVISRVPAETDGGAIYASSHVELGKSIGIAAGVTLGPLGDAFVTTSVPGFLNPTFVTAQYPPSKVFPTHASAKTTTNAGPISAGSFTASSDASPAAVADAIGGSGGVSGLLQVGGGTSHSESKVLSDGTVSTRATSTLSNVGVGPAGHPILTIATMTSTAMVTVPLGAAATKSVTVTMGGVLLAGIPIEITQRGVNLAGSLPVPATGVATVNAALAALTQLGITVQAVPVVAQTTDGGASTSGAALELGYQVPASLLGQLPTDIGTNETVLLGQVTATATAHPHQALILPAPPAPAPTETAVTPSAGGSFAPPAGPAPAPGVPVVPSAAPTPAAAPQSSLFVLPRRTQNAAARTFLADYRIFVIAAVATGGVFLFCRKTRLVD